MALEEILATLVALSLPIWLLVEEIARVSRPSVPVRVAHQIHRAPAAARVVRTTTAQ